MILFFDCTCCRKEIEFSVPDQSRKSIETNAVCPKCKSPYRVSIYFEGGCFLGYKAFPDQDLVEKKPRDWFISQIKDYYKMTNDPMSDALLKLIVTQWQGSDEELIALFEQYKLDYIKHSYQVKNMVRNDRRVTDKVKELLEKKKRKKK